MENSVPNLSSKKGASLYIPLAKYEKDLIDDFVSTFDWVSPPLEILESTAFVFAFTHWSWTRKYYDAFVTILTNDAWTEHHQGRWGEIWNCVERILPHGAAMIGSSRFNGLEAANADTIINNGPAEEMELMPEPQEEDLSSWAILTSLIEFYKKSEPEFVETRLSTPGGSDSEGRLTTFDLLIKSMSDSVLSTDIDEVDEGDGLKGEDLERLRVNEWTFDIWSLLRACATILRREATSLQKAKEGLKDTGFYDLHDPVLNGHVRNTKVRPGAQVSTAGYQLTQKGLRVISFGEEPSKFVEFISWDQLNHIDHSDSTHEFDEHGLVLWKPPKLMAWDKHLFTEDSVFQACVEAQKCFPNYHLDHGVCFLLTPISEFRLETGAAGGFWGHWNDCAISHDPITCRWYLLQTIPGFRFRQLHRARNPGAALQYFRSFIEQEIYGRITSLEDALGLDFKPQYSNLLTLIPFQQIVSIDPSPLGEGTRGVVFRATWMQQNALETSRTKTVDVALKSIKVHGTEDVKRFIAELDTTFTAVVGTSIHVVGLHGITKTPSKRVMQSRHGLEILPHDTVFLVLEYATFGRLNQYLRERLTGHPSDWLLLLDAMADIAHGIYEIHGRKIIHRDIHWNNVLVSSRSFEGDPGPVVTSKTVLIGDLGEGQVFANQLQSRTYYGNPDFWAPEVKQHHHHHHHHHTFASDIYAIGCLFYQMLLLQWELTPSVENIDSRQQQHGVPRVVIELIYASLQEDPDTRPEARELLDSLEDLRIDEEAPYEDNEGELELVSLTEIQLDGLLRHCRRSTQNTTMPMDEIPT